MILPCSCNHPIQDQFHGKGRRVYNVGKTDAKCTVCGNKHPLTAEQRKDSATKSKSKS